MIQQGGTIGILGGGQLGRMLAVAGTQLGYRVVGYAPEGDNVAAPLSANFHTADWNDKEALKAFADECDVVTWEFENVPLSAVDVIPRAKLPCPAKALETAQDRLLEKQFVETLGGQPASYRTVDSLADCEAAMADLGPGILKTRRDGYDGKGQWRVSSAGDLDDVTFDTPLIYEAMVHFDAEFSVILARNAAGRIRIYHSARNQHGGGILTRSDVPAGPQVERHVPAARELAVKVADALGYVGVLTLEFFATTEGPVFNEMAPRVHNSGHWTIEGAVTSQFENHIRAICGLPLGDAACTAPTIAMHNLIGEEADDLTGLLEDPTRHVHIYGKAEAREGRKMGHVTKLTGHTA